MKNIQPIATDMKILATMLTGGNSLPKAARELSTMGTAVQTRFGFTLIREALAKGAPLGRLLEANFPGAYGWSEPGVVDLIKAGDVGGVLSEDLSRAVWYLECHNTRTANAEMVLLGYLLQGGVPILQGIQTLAKTSGLSPEMAYAFTLFAGAIRNGDKISDVYKDVLLVLWDEGVYQALRSGEQDGMLDAQLLAFA